jgi:hypothetical protein
MFLTDATILSAIADCLQVAGGSAALPAYWSNIVTRQHPFAYQYLVGQLVNRGYLLSQILQWDQGPYYEQQLSEFFVFTDAASTHKLDPEMLRIRDVRKELNSVVISVNNAFIQPMASGDEPGTVGMGDMDQDGVFDWPDRHQLRRELW